MFTGVLRSKLSAHCTIIIIISDEEIRVTLSYRDVAGALYIN